MERKIRFICKAVRWFDKINGNTYHSVNITDIKTNRVYKSSFEYGYGTHYEQTTQEILLKNNLLPKKYNKNNLYLYERENNYPIEYIVIDSTKKECMQNIA